MVAACKDLVAVACRVADRTWVAGPACYSIVQAIEMGIPS